MSGLRLPNGLLDLVLAHTFPATRQTARRTSPLLISGDAVLKRYAQSAAAYQPRVDPAIDHSQLVAEKKGENVNLYGPLTPRASMTRFEESALRLKTMGNEQAGLLPGGLRYSEEEILAVYEDLLAIPREEQIPVETPDDGVLFPVQIVNSAIQRLSPQQPLQSDQLAPHRTLINRLEEVVNNTDEASLANSGGVMPQSSNQLLSEGEWQALLQTSLNESDLASAEQVLRLMERLGSPPSEECLNLLLAFHANNGDIQSADHFVKHSLVEAPSARQRDLHIKAYLQAARSTAFPTQALHLLHDYELRGIAPPQKSYARVIGHLLHAGTSVAHAHAWDLFSHMRYVAHPTPDVFMYTRMIKACSASAISPAGEPERALDLWTEMTIDKRIPPTTEAYTATILACARSGRKTYVHEAFRLAKEMMDSHRDARGMAAFSPNAQFFSALLQGAKRIGDLGRVRWILAEMVRNSLLAGTQQGRERESGVKIADDAIVRENVMVHVFHAYAAYKPPFKRSMAVVVDGEGEKEASDRHKEGNSDAETQTSEQKDTQEKGGEIVPEEHISFAQIPPQTHGEVIQEAEALFARIVADQASVSPEEAEEAGPAVFRHVQITSRLVNAYLSVHYAHSPIDAWQQLAKTVHEQVGVSRNAFSYVELLERCTLARRGPDRGAALKLAEDVWEEWSGVEARWRDGVDKVEGMAPRQVERAYSAMVKMFSLTKQLDRALELVRNFVEAYPPSAVREVTKKPSLLSTRTSLVAARPLVRLMSSVEVPDDTVPPLLIFTEVESLHHRLVAADRKKDIKYLKWVCKSYEGALRARRDAAIHAQPEKSAGVPVEVKGDNA